MPLIRLVSPEFWYGGKDTAAGRLKAAALTPLSLLYLAGRRIHTACARPYRPKVPVLCAGNLVAGGSGKTPVAIALMDIVRKEKIAANPCFLSRGYGGDESAILARRAPSITDPDRARGARHAEDEGHDLIVMDDGLQNPGLEKTLRFVVIDGETGFGNGKILPAGPLRVPLRGGLAEADAFILIGPDKTGATALLPPGKPVFRATLDIPETWAKSASSQRWAAFAGIGRPEKFRAALRRSGIEPVAWHAFPDHHPYTPADLARLQKEADRSGARLLTTEKDAVRLPPSCPCESAPVEIRWADENSPAAFIAESIRRGEQP